MAPPREDAVLLLVVYVVPLALASALLWVAGLPRLALALLAVEAVVAGAVVAVRRRPAPARGGRTALGWALPVALVLAIGAVTAATLLLGR